MFSFPSYINECTRTHIYLNTKSGVFCSCELALQCARSRVAGDAQHSRTPRSSRAGSTDCSTHLNDRQSHTHHRGREEGRVSCVLCMYNLPSFLKETFPLLFFQRFSLKQFRRNAIHIFLKCAEREFQGLETKRSSGSSSSSSSINRKSVA